MNSKKIRRAGLALIALAAILTMTAGCGRGFSTTSENVQTYNGISLVERTVTENGETSTETFYRDADGNVMDEEEGRLAFEAAKAEVNG